MKSIFGFIQLSVKVFCFVVLIRCVSSEPPKEPKNEATVLELGRQYLGAGDFVKAIAQLRPLTHDAPKNTEALNLLGMAYLGQGAFDVAEVTFAKAVKLNRYDDDLNLNLAYSKILTKKFSEARLILDQIRKRGQYLYMEKIHSNYGLSYLEENRCNLAFKEFQAALQLDPTLVAAHFNQGKCYYMSKNYKSAAMSFRKALEFCSGCVQPALELAKVQFRLGQKQEAVAEVKRLLNSKLEPKQLLQAQELLKRLLR